MSEAAFTYVLYDTPQLFRNRSETAVPVELQGGELRCIINPLFNGAQLMALLVVLLVRKRQVRNRFRLRISWSLSARDLP